jgi:hypothetical protein
MRSWKSLRLTSHTWLGLNPQIGRPLSRIVVPLVYLFYFLSDLATARHMERKYNINFPIGLITCKNCCTKEIQPNQLVREDIINQNEEEFVPPLEPNSKFLNTFNSIITILPTCKLLCLPSKKRSKTNSEVSEKSLKKISVEYNRIIDAVKADLSEAMFPGEGEDQTDMEIEQNCTELISCVENVAERKLKVLN